MTNFLEKEIELYQEQKPETWKADHKLVMFYYDVKNWVIFGINLFNQIGDLDNDVQEDRLTGGLAIEDGAELEENIRTLYKEWLKSTEKLPVLDFLASKGHPVEERDRLEACVREAKGILTPDREFFRDEAFAGLRDDALDAFHRGETQPMK